MHPVRTSTRLIALVLAMFVAGCHSSPEPDQLNVALAVFPDEAARYESFVADFESQHHVHVKVFAQTYADILQAMRVQAGSRGSLDQVVSPTARALFTKEAWDAATIDRQLSFIPHRLMWQAMIYNRVEVPN